jgi:hypothetical protein
MTRIEWESLVGALRDELKRDRLEPSRIAEKLLAVMNPLVAAQPTRDVADPCELVDGLVNRYIFDEPGCVSGLDTLKHCAPALSDVISGMGHCLHDALSSPTIAERFGCMPQQLKVKVEAYIAANAGILGDSHEWHVDKT